MHFCVNCDNMYYLRISEDEDWNSLIYYCRNCGHENKDLDYNNICVSKTNIVKNEQNYDHIINEYTKLDYTLPRITTIKCPNDKCPSNKEQSTKDSDESSKSTEESLSETSEEREVLYIRYDDINMKYIYMCTKCDTVWNTNSN